MGNKNSKIHLETAHKTGACTLSQLNLEELPNELFKIAKLRSLDISQNKLTFLPNELARFVNLKMFNVSTNRLRQLDQPIIQALTKLETLIAHSNLFVQMPSFTACRQLKTVDFSNNGLKSISKSLYNLPQLDMLNLQKNKITQIEETDLDKLKCVEVNLNQNRINQIPLTLKKCARLKVLRIEENCLPEIPGAILQESTIAVLYTAGNLFTEKDLQNMDGYDEYSKRYTEAKRKADFT